MKGIKLSKKGDDLIKLYEEMAVNGINRTDGKRKENVYNDFQLREFRNLCQNQISSEKIKTVLDYGEKAQIGMLQTLTLKQISQQKIFFL